MGKLLEINGPLVRLDLPGARLSEQVRVGGLGLLGEVIHLEGDHALAQLYEDSTGLAPGEPAEGLGYPLSVELGPGLLGGIFDGVQRPLEVLWRTSGDRISRGIVLPALNRQQTWRFEPARAPGLAVAAGALLGTVRETASIEHRILVPPGLAGDLLELAPVGDYRIEDTLAHLRASDGSIHKLTLVQRWPVRMPRPFRRRDHVGEPLITGQRILDTFYPLLKGGKAAIPGPFGAGKTMLQHQIARWCNAEIVIYVGCGERGNEMADVLETLPRLSDPYSGRPLMERTLLIANTSNMPVVAREASVYVGITIAEYFRDQGYDVVMVADSTSRWAEALREVAGRLGQMPVEEGYPAYLGSRLAAFYERAGRVETLAGGIGSVTLIGAVSPPGGDFSEPVTSHTKEIIQTFWALSKELADARHYPAIDWLESFSGYVGEAARWWAEHVDPGWAEARALALKLLSESEELRRIVNLVGVEALSSEQRWALESAELLKVALLQQSATDTVDSYAAPAKQYWLLQGMLAIHAAGEKLVQMGVPARRLLEMPVMQEARRWKTRYGAEQLDALRERVARLSDDFGPLEAEYRVFPGTAPETSHAVSSKPREPRA